MDIKKVAAERQRVLKKLNELGYNTDKKIIDLKIEDLLNLPTFNRAELSISVELKKALINKEIIAFLNAADLIKNNN